MKPATACKRCRAGKRKCWRRTTGEDCLQCRRCRVPCSLARTLPSPSTGGIPSAPKSPHDRTGTQSLPVSEEIATQLVEEYIRCILDRPHSIFHLPALRAAVRERKLPAALHYALLSYGARFYPEPSVSSLGEQFFENAKEHLSSDVEHVCLENVQACILLANLSAAYGFTSSESLYLSIAIHMAEVLQLNAPPPADPQWLQEQKRRVWCSLFMADYWCAVGNGLRRKMANCPMDSVLPMDERVFHKIDVGLSTTEQTSSPGLWAHMITLVEIFGDIQDLNSHIVRQTLDEELVSHRVVALADALTSWETNLPDHTQYSVANLYRFRSAGLGGPFVTLHLGFYHYSTLLYYQYLDIRRATTPTTQGFANMCKKHAIDQSNMLRTARQIGNCEVLHPGAGHCVVISSSVLLHTVLFGEHFEVSQAQDHLRSNFEILQELARYWPSLELVVRRLNVFQRTCTTRTASDSYKFDKWVVAFLLEYHLSLEDRCGDHLAHGNVVTEDGGL